jgi:hypothetical protein
MTANAETEACSIGWSDALKLDGSTKSTDGSMMLRLKFGFEVIF